MVLCQMGKPAFQKNIGHTQSFTGLLQKGLSSIENDWMLEEECKELCPNRSWDSIYGKFMRIRKKSIEAAGTNRTVSQLYFTIQQKLFALRSQRFGQRAEERSRESGRRNFWSSGSSGHFHSGSITRIFENPRKRMKRSKKPKTVKYTERSRKRPNL